MDVSNGVILNLMDDASSWLPGDQIVIASTDYSMHQAEEFDLLPCPGCNIYQIKIGKNCESTIILGLSLFKNFISKILWINTSDLFYSVDLNCAMLFEVYLGTVLICNLFPVFSTVTRNVDYVLNLKCRKQYFIDVQFCSTNLNSEHWAFRHKMLE